VVSGPSGRPSGSGRARVTPTRSPLTAVRRQGGDGFLAPWGTGALVGALAGVAVGAVDGLRASVEMEMSLAGIGGAAALAASVDGLVGWLLGLVVEIIARGAAWGWRARVPRWAEVVSFLPWAALSSTATITALVATAGRRERFLAGGIVVLAMWIAGAAGAVLAPLVARFAAGKHVDSAAMRRPSARITSTAWVAVPFAATVVGLVVFSAVSHVAAPLRGRSLRILGVLIGAEAAALPWLLWAGLVLPLEVPVPWARAISVVLGAVVLAVGGITNWENHLRFIPWHHVVVIVAIAIVGLGALALDRALSRWSRLPGGMRSLATFVAPLILAMTALAATHNEAARKAVDARAGVAGPTLVAAWSALDFDGDGYPRWIGGGDCNDRDPDVNPGAMDYPDDGTDQDCNGTDASTSLLTSPKLGPLPPSVRPDLNVLFVTVDTLRADHLGCYGYGRPTSPRIDELAAAGALFTNGWAHAPSTRYSMPALATGRWPSAIAWDESIWWPRIAPSTPTLAELIKAHGLLTAAFYSFSYFARGDHRGFERGIDLYRDDRAVLHVAVNGPMESHGSSSREMADDTIAFLDAHKAERFFLWTHYYDPHLGYEPHGEVPSFGSERVDLYDGEIRFTDLHLGRVIDHLKALGLWDRTAIVLTGDHGEGFGEHGVTEHGFDLYAPQTKVPMIVRVPGAPPRVVEEPAGHIDLTATMAHLAGLTSAQEPRLSSLLGRSLVPEIVGQAREATPVFQEVTSERGKKRALVDARFHLIWNWAPSNTTECYDLSEDPREVHDAWQGGGSPSRCRELKASLENMVAVLSLPPGFREKLAAGLLPPQAPDPTPQKGLGARFGDAIEVMGVDVDRAEPKPGQSVTITTWFKVRKPVPAGFNLFFHALGPGGMFRNLDHVPLEGALPVSRWREGMRLRDTVSLALPEGTPPGTYEIVMGFFKSGERLPLSPATASNGENALRLAQLIVR